MAKVEEEVECIVRAMHRKGYKTFLSSDRPFNLNIVGIRNSSPKIDSFNDRLVVFWRYNKKLYYGEYPITTLPGEYYLIHKLLNQKGAAILCPGQYRGAYSLGLHKGSYEALVQSKPVKVFRDGDRDDEYDLDPNTLEQGYFGINIHRAYKKGKAPKVGKTSAGCQVFQSALDYAEFMECCAHAFEEWGNSFTYTLLEENDLTEA